jgi:GGDEF domain-containing protein
MVETIMSCVLMIFWFSKTRFAGLATGDGAISAMLSALGTYTDDYDLIYYGISFFIIIVLFAARSTRRLQGLNPLYRFEISVFIFAVSCTYYFVVAGQNIFAIATTNSIVFAAICAVTAKDLIAEKRPNLIPGCKILGYMFVGFMLFQLLKLFARPLVEAVPSFSTQIAMIDYLDLFVAMSTAIGSSFGLIWASYKQTEFQLLAAKKIAEQQARTDTLTGLSNRRAFFEYTDVVDAQARRYQRSFVIAIIDIDNLKVSNDTWGHHAGDIALKEIASVISKVLRETDIVRRIGGEEFSVILAETLHEDGIHMADAYSRPSKSL